MNNAAGASVDATSSTATATDTSVPVNDNDRTSVTKKRVLIDIEAMYELDEYAAKLYEEQFGKNLSEYNTQVIDFPVKYNFSPEVGKKLESIYLQEGFFRNIPPIPNVVHAIQTMSENGMDVWIVISTTIGEPRAVHEQLLWISDKLGHVHSDRVIISKDKTLLKADFLIDPQPFPEKNTIKFFASRRESPKGEVVEKTVSWNHILYDREYNTSINKQRMNSWKNWKQIFTGEDPYASLPFFRHGSADSLDEDRLYLFPEMPDDKTCRQFISGVSDDRNIFVITDGYVSDCYKGYPDEIQNALQETYPLHKQEFQLPLSVRAQRVVTLKIICALTGILVRLSQSDYRGEVKTALRAPNWAFRRKVSLETLVFEKINNLRLDDYKFIAFQYGQAIALIQGRELYTKKSIAEYFPELSPFLKREKDAILQNLIHLDSFKKQLKQLTDGVEVSQKGDLVVFTCPDYKDDDENTNFYKKECRGLVVDLKKDRVVFYGIPYFSKKNPQWPVEKEEFLTKFNSETNLYGLFKNNGEIILSSLKTIENELKKELETFFKISELNYDLYWYILRISRKSAESSSENSLHVEVLGIRHKFSFKMYEGKENELIQDTVKKTGFCFAL